jgi:hypothetical protein
MSTKSSDVFPYLLIDNGLLHGKSSHYAETQESPRPDWLEPIYTDKALAVSPLLIDIGAAYEADQLDRMMALANACKPALHTSLIETTLTLEELARHLRRLIFVVAPDGKQYTLRFADCVVLGALCSVLAPEQWGAVTEPMFRWRVHDRNDSTSSLPPASSDHESGTFPLRLSATQIDALTEALEPDHVLANVKAMRHGAALPGNALQQYERICAARSIWMANDNRNDKLLTAFVEATLTTEGEILGRPEVKSLLFERDSGLFSKRLRELVREMEERRIRLKQMAENRLEMQSEFIQ